MNVGPIGGAAMTHEEIARRLGVSVRTVMRDEQSALRKLRLSLEAIGDELAFREMVHRQKEAA